MLLFTFIRTVDQMCYTFLAKEPICSYCSFPDFEMDDSEPMPEVHAIFADKIQIPEPYLSPQHLQQ